MKWFNFLTTKVGKIHIGFPQLLIGVTAAGVITYGALNRETPKNEEAMRTSLAGTTTAEDFGMARDSKGRVTAMNIGGGHRLDFSSDNDSKFSANEGAAGRLSSGFQGGNYGVGTGAQFGETEGLGTGGIEATEIGAGGKAISNDAYKGALNGDAVSAAAAAAGKHGADSQRLATTTIAKASRSGGNGSIAMNGATSGGQVGSASAGNGHVRMDKAGENSAYNFSGKMDQGTFLANNPKAGKASFGGNRDLTVGKARRPISGEGSEIQQMYNITKQVASDTDRNAAAGMTAFLNDGYHGVGMGQNTMAEAGGAAISNDLENAANKLRRKPFKSLEDDTNKEDKERAKDDNLLTGLLYGLLVSTLLLGGIGFKLIYAGKLAMKVAMKLQPLTVAEAAAKAAAIAAAKAKIIAGWVMLGAGMAYAGVVFGFGSAYAAKYGTKSNPLALGGILAPIASMALLATLGVLAQKLTGKEKAAKGMEKLDKGVKTVIKGGTMPTLEMGGKMLAANNSSGSGDTASAADDKTGGSDSKKS